MTKYHNYCIVYRYLYSTSHEAKQKCFKVLFDKMRARYSSPFQAPPTIRHWVISQTPNGPQHMSHYIHSKLGKQYLSHSQDTETRPYNSIHGHLPTSLSPQLR